MTVENTTKRAPEAHLLGMMVEGQSGYIEGMEADGQRQLVNSDVLPRCQNADDVRRMEELGFTFGEPTDDLFRHATLPAGWQREGSGHAMWSYIVDERGLQRVAIFYKAAFYDRDAFMRLVRVGSDLASSFIYSEGDPTVPWDVLTETERDEYRNELKAYIEQASDPVTGHIYQRDGRGDRALAELERVGE